MTPAIGELQFLRPAWLLALLVLPLLALAWRRRARQRSAWLEAVDPHLLPHLLEPGGGARRRAFSGVAVLAGLGLAIVALAGPSWRSVPQPLQSGGGALVIALDLSSATLANDLQPSRLAQARARLSALLGAHAGEVALVVYADDAHVVSPLTPDAANVAVFLDALAPEVMPVDGQRPARAIALAAELLQQAGHARGAILLLAPGADAAAVRAAGRAADQGFTVSALAMGTAAGAGYRGRDGGIHRSALDADALRALADAGGGQVHTWDAAPAEVLADAVAAGGASGNGTVRAGRVREDGGYWLLPLAMGLLLAAFRRGGVLAAVAVCLLLPMPMPPALARQPADALGGARPAAGASAAPGVARAPGSPPRAPAGTPWRRADQAAHARSVEAEAAYRRGDFAAAARGFAGLPGADAAYNRGNALARAGRYEEAIAAYDDALRQAPDMPDALANRAAVQAALRRDPPQGGGQGGDTGPDGGQGGRGPGQEAGDRGDDGQAPPDDDPGRDEGGDDPGPQPLASPEDAGGAPPSTGDQDAQTQARQQAADAAQREAMQRALEAAAAAGAGRGDDDPHSVAGQSESTAATEREAANAAWLRRVPDDPGALLRARFRNEHLRRRAGER